MTTVPGHVRTWKIDRVGDISVFQEVHQLISRHHGAILFRLVGTRPDVRQQERVGPAEQLGSRKVRDVVAQLARIKRCDHRIGIHHLLAGKIQHACKAC